MKRRSPFGQFLGHFLEMPLAARPKRVRAGCELLEDRSMLSATDLLVSTFLDTGGLSVLRYDEDDWTPAAGGVAASEDFDVAQGIATAPDGTFYVSNALNQPGEVWHFDSDGTFLDVLGAGDAFPVTLYVPGTLEFGPNGHLYVADIGASTIYEFDTEAVGQQAIGGTYLGDNYFPGGFAVALDGTNDIIAGGLYNQTITRYHNGAPLANLIVDPLDGNDINTGAILAQPNGDLLIADFNVGGEESLHHRIVKWHANDGTVSTFINLTTPTSDGTPTGDPPQPTALLLDHDGNLLVAMSPDHDHHGAVAKFDIDTGDPIGSPFITDIGIPSGMAFVPNGTSTIAGTGHEGRYVFYNQSGFDGNSAANNASDNGAIPPSKTAYLPGDGQMVLANITNFTKGLNGIMVDLTAGSADHTLINASDFVFKVGANNSPDTWTTLTATPTISVRTGGGISGSDRVDITWNNGAIQDEYLEVQVLATAHTGMDANFGTISGNAVGDVFFFGNLIGETASVTPGGNFARSLSADGNPIVAAGVVGGVGIDSFLDVDRSNSITLSGDRNPIVAGGVGSMIRISIGMAGPFAPTGGGSGGDAGISSGLAATPGSSSSSSSTLALPASVATRLDSAGSTVGVVSTYSQLLDDAGAAAADDADDAGLDDETLDSIVEGLRAG